MTSVHSSAFQTSAAQTSDAQDTPQLEEVSERIRALARKGPLPTERAMAEALGVNRYMLRKALRALRATDEIPASRPRNAGRREITRRQISELTSPAEVWEVRLLIEPEIARLAAARGTSAEIEHIRRTHAQAERDVFDLESDIAFHVAVAAACHNALSIYLVETICDLTRDDTFRTRLPTFTRETGWGHHDRILRAITERRAADAETAMRAHLGAILNWLNGRPANAHPHLAMHTGEVLS